MPPLGEGVQCQGSCSEGKRVRQTKTESLTEVATMSINDARSCRTFSREAL